MDGILALTRRHLLFLDTIVLCYVCQQHKTSAPGDEDTVPFLLKQPTVQPFREKEEEGHLMVTVILMSSVSKLSQSK